MEIVLEYIARGYIPLIANIGLLALLAWAVSLFGRYIFVESRHPSPAAASIVGTTFGLTAALLMVVPIEMEPGIIGDGRGAPILMSGIVGGPVAAAITCVIAAGMRLYLGGPGAPGGALYIVIIACAGVIWNYVSIRRQHSGIDIPAFVLLATITTAATAPVVLLFPPAKQLPVLLTLWPQLWAANVVGVIILGTLIRREHQRRMAENALVEERSRAEREANARTRFLNAMSHEMRTPLNGILGILQLVQNKSLPAEVRRDLNVASDSGNYLLTLINQVLDLAKLDAGKTIVNMEPFTVAALVDNLYSMFKYQADGKGLQFRTHLVGDTETVLLGDFEHIRQVLFNLLGNAIKFTKAGNVDILARVQGQGESRLLRVEVSDTGPGIPADQQESIFGEFHQTAVGARTQASTGLGLSICRQLTDAMGARLAVESSEGAGSTFSFEADLKITDALPAMQTGTEDAGAVEPLRILVAEDNSVNQMVVRGMLEQDGHTVFIADDGKVAVETMAQMPDAFDLILMDIQMPEMDGLDATRAIRALPDVPGDFPIVALTANAFTNQREEFIAAGMDDVLTKPLRLEDLRRKLLQIGQTASPGDNDNDASATPDTPESLGPDAVADEQIAAMAEKMTELVGLFGKHKMLEMLEEFETSSRDMIERMRRSDNNVPDRKPLAHQLAGMTANLGFENIAELARRIEYDALDTAETEELIETMDGTLTESLNFARQTIAPLESRERPGQDKN